MQRWAGLDEVPASHGPSVVTIGVFDGVHRGHQHLVSRAVAAARQAGVASVAVTFHPHPLAVVRPGSEPLALATLDRRVELLGATGVDAVCVLPFTPELSRRSAEDFAVHVLAEQLHAVLVVVGENFRFGHKAAGDVRLLAEIGHRYGFDVDPVPLAGGEPRWSSTRVRAALAAGDVREAQDVLGHPYRIEGEVVVGDRRGRELGYPTANLAVPRGLAVPADGVYAGWLLADGGRLPAAISIGTNPTFDGSERRVEAYALDRNDLDLYGRHVAVDLTHRLRETVRFGSVEALLQQMADDVVRARSLLGSAGG